MIAFMLVDIVVSGRHGKLRIGVWDPILNSITVSR